MKVVQRFKALSDVSRVRALCALNDQELCVCQIVEVLGLAASTVSKHMSILANADLVESTKKGRWVYYRLALGADTQVRQLLSLLPELVADEAQLEFDRRALARILTIDPESLCRLQSEKAETP